MRVVNKTIQYNQIWQQQPALGFEAPQQTVALQDDANIAFSERVLYGRTLVKNKGHAAKEHFRKNRA